MLFNYYKRLELCTHTFRSYSVFLVQVAERTQNRLWVGSEPKSSFGTGSVRLGSEPVLAMTLSRFGAGVVATLTYVLWCWNLGIKYQVVTGVLTRKKLSFSMRSRTSTFNNQQSKWKNLKWEVMCLGLLTDTVPTVYGRNIWLPMPYRGAEKVTHTVRIRYSWTPVTAVLYGKIRPHTVLRVWYAKQD